MDLLQIKFHKKQDIKSEQDSKIAARFFIFGKNRETKIVNRHGNLPTVFDMHMGSVMIKRQGNVRKRTKIILADYHTQRCIGMK